MTNLQVLRAARQELATHHVPLVFDERLHRTEVRNYSGTGQGCCINGAVTRAQCKSRFDDRSAYIVSIVSASCRELYPGWRGAKLKRLGAVDGELIKAFNYYWDREMWDWFDHAPALFVNNHLGKSAILAAMDHAIAKLERDDKLESLSPTGECG